MIINFTGITKKKKELKNCFSRQQGGGHVMTWEGFCFNDPNISKILGQKNKIRGLPGYFTYQFTDNNEFFSRTGLCFLARRDIQNYENVVFAKQYRTIRLDSTVRIWIPWRTYGESYLIKFMKMESNYMCKWLKNCNWQNVIWSIFFCNGMLN